MTKKRVEKESDAEFDDRAEFRVESELKEKVKETAGLFDQEESWGWRHLTAMALGDNAPDKYKAKLSRLGLKK